MPFLESIRRVIQQYQLVSPGQTLVIGVSGGADSLALMVALYQLQQTLAIKLHIATLDHGWRGAQSAADAQFVVEEARKRGLPVTLRKQSLQFTDSNLEAAGRRARYNLFAEVANEIGAEVVAVAHHRDDQAETILMRLLRGAGLHGLQGMGWRSTVPYHPHLTLIRPLLNVTRAEVEAFCNAQGLHPRYDPTNYDPTFLRNRVRHEVLPYLRQINPNINAGLVRLADIASVESDFVAKQTHFYIEKHAFQRDQRWLFPRNKFNQLHPAIQRRIIAALVQRVTTDEQMDIDHNHIIAAVRIATEGKLGAIAQFINGIQMRVTYDDLIFELDTMPDKPILSLNAGTTLPFKHSEPIHLSLGWVVLSESVPDGYQKLCTVYLPNDQNEDARLRIRTREAGDRIALPGMNGHTQKLKDWMINRKIPRLHRNDIPIISYNTKVVVVIHVTESVVAEPYNMPEDNWKAWILSWKI